MTKMMANPRYRPSCAVMTIALGLAMFAFEHSSLRWKGASYPDIVQITLRKPHHKGKAGRPLCAVDDVRPHIVAVVRLGGVDRAHGKPDNEDDDDDEVDDRPDLVQLANESC